MGEIVAWPQAEDRECTGGRLPTTPSSEWRFEDRHRYLLARELARGLDVLDVTCGGGSSSSLLAQTARTVIGVDISGEAVRGKITFCATDTPSLQQGNGQKRRIADASVDLVIAFDTIEHVHENELFLTEIKRVLRFGGALLLSTRDRAARSPAGQPPYPQQVRELDGAEFRALLGRHFAHQWYQRQHALHGSTLMADELSQGSPHLRFERRGADHFETFSGIARAHSMVALASDEERHRLPSSVYVDGYRLSHMDGLKLEAFRAGDPERLEAAEAEIAEAKAALELANRRVSALQESCSRAEEAVRLYRAQAGLAHELNQSLASMRASTSWRLSAPIRVLGQMLRRS